MKMLRAASVVLCAGLLACTQQDPDAASKAAGSLPSLVKPKPKARKIVAPDMVQPSKIRPPRK
ncbi:MAG: hypothetical protein NXI35_04605 [bacterium]|nr:hypothetical protein [bacterium]